MKKKLLSVLLTALISTSAMTGCGTSVDVGFNDVNYKEDIYKAVQIVGDMKEAGISFDASAGISVKDTESYSGVTEETYDMDITSVRLADYSAETIESIENQVKPLEIVASEKLTEALHVGKVWKDKIHEVNETAAAQAEIKLVDIDLDSEIVTYRVTAPDILGYLYENLKPENVDSICESLPENLEEDEFPIVVNYVSLPITVSGSDISVDVMNEKLMSSITGGFSSVIEVLQ